MPKLNCDDYDCDDCSSHESEEDKENKYCPDSNNTVLQSECGAYAVDAKKDACKKCPYTYYYP